MIRSLTGLLKDLAKAFSPTVLTVVNVPFDTGF